MSGGVLVVEDDPDLLSLVEMILRDAGHEVAVASDGLQALARVEERMPAVILLDMRMPVMNGWEFAREYRARYGHPAPIVVVTAAEDARARAQEIGADAWLEKPFDLDDVVRMVDRFAAPPGGTAHAP
ncbi:response regulator [Anaeromyxobacter diazotrophicus]|uniref:Response regulator n=1 Tax=Anaeromyxobacter diazotrophicus TaxID=2590199 RepID=A0A7I9VJE8_9BACT|nr:response regulator [Anaeromyxobacter diazotrophicus]GEJ56309.1 response regulator [Anaeromyxobacter diazotrophicus]